MDSISSSVRSTGLDAIFQYTGTGVQLFSGSIFYIIVTHLFTPSGVGAIALFVAIVSLFNSIFSFGLGTASQHFISYDLGVGNFASARRTVYKILSYGTTLALAGFVTLIALAPVISIVFLHSSSYTFLVRLLSIVLFGNVMFGILNGTLLGTQNFRLSALINIVIWTAYYFGTILLATYIRSLDTVVIGWAFGIFVGVAIEFIAVIRSIGKMHGAGHSVSTPYIFAYSFPILLSGLISFGASSADRFIVSGMLNLSYLGIYNFALLISNSIGFIAIPFTNILMPKFSELYGKGMKQQIAPLVRVSTTLLSTIYIPAAIGIAALSPIILHLLAGVQYESSSSALRIIMFSTALFVSQNIMAQAIASIRLTRIFLYSSILSFSSNIVLSFLLIPRYGLVGAALGYSSVFATVFLILWHFARVNGVGALNIKGLAKAWISAVIMFFVLIILEHMLGVGIHLLPIYIGLGFLVYFGLAKFFKVFSADERDLVLALFPPNFVRIRQIISILILH